MASLRTNEDVKEHFEKKSVITRNERCWNIPGFPAKQGTVQLFALCVCSRPYIVLVLEASAFGPQEFGESKVRFSKRNNNRK